MSCLISPKAEPEIRTWHALTREMVPGSKSEDAWEREREGRKKN